MGWRSLIVLEEGAEAEVWEQYLAGDPGADALFNGVTELRVGEGATLRFVCGQDLSDSAWVFATQRAEVERDAS
ncbi:MAG: SufD family Fe-S cluster assembly protein, partial [Actinomycetota bacterium]|nr:SufD family Fe-S cluster assembly protein [Actinomycetota bacterium]